jgi:FMN phosphatase YigB (HAD superfamily)
VRLFLRACRALKVQPSDCVMVGDRIDNVIVPARTLGMRTVLLRSGFHKDQRPRTWDEAPDFDVFNVEGLLPGAIEFAIAL